MSPFRSPCIVDFATSVAVPLTSELHFNVERQWTVELPVAEMGLLDNHQGFSKSPVGSELNSIMVYTLDQDVELEIHQVELLPHPTRK